MIDLFSSPRMMSRGVKSAFSPQELLLLKRKKTYETNSYREDCNSQMNSKEQERKEKMFFFYNLAVEWRTIVKRDDVIFFFFFSAVGIIEKKNSFFFLFFFPIPLSSLQHIRAEEENAEKQRNE